MFDLVINGYFLLIPSILHPKVAAADFLGGGRADKLFCRAWKQVMSVTQDRM